ncbi:SDR family NAD(P)-dependent oxidoreductase [Pontixanthobacter aquaemixtae]|uniref:Glucose 1-dehydrogenase n=1 Tax=Pontixanthobacter aquaemixtae TaxID=1958940 RepID=A0A844ZNC0_9SPHN|nr:SDR family NAD(P)-dependent oxidoreductase [Pontixanthobacter aquaemixtae]MXO89871.1 glucose 1-dehydrogenase [Pontixanthobacter aquaemixtae]
MTGRLHNKTAIITGAASGIGKASALLFSKEGANVIAFDRTDAVHEVAGRINEAGGRATAIAGDAGSESDVEALVKAAQATYGGLHVMFANAGITGGVRGGFFDATPDDWTEVLRVNLIGPFLAVKHAAPIIQESGGGAIVCTASVAGLRSGAGPAQYSASKAGVINLVQTAAQQLAGTGVRVNAVLPGLTETGMTKPMYDGARAAGKEHRIGQLNPMLRGGEPHEIAAAALFLASEEASYVNGQALAIDGGLSSSHPTSRPPGDPKRPSS